MAQLLAIAGFGTANPIIPFYVQELGVKDLARVKIWVGLIQTGGAAMVAVFSPIWGRLADSYGRRLMFLRALVGGTIMMVLMGVASHPWQILLFRMLGGIFTGTIAAATVLVATTVPRDQTGYSLGMLQTAVLVGSALGPVIGGTVSDLLGYRAAFFVTAALLASAALVVVFVVREKFVRRPLTGSLWSRLLPDFGTVTRSRELFSLLVIVGTIQMSGSVLVPILPLFIQSILPGGQFIGSTTGFIIGMRALTGALAAAGIGRASDRLGYKRVLLACIVGGVLSHVALVWVTATWQLLVLRMTAGFFLGGTLPALNALIAVKADRSNQGSVYGLSSSMSSAGTAVGPAIGATVGAAWGYAPVFLTTAGILVASGAIVALFVAGRLIEGRSR